MTANVPVAASANGTDSNGINGTNSASRIHEPELAKIPLWINGKEVTTKTAVDVISSHDAKAAHQFYSATKDDALEAIKAAEASFPSWSKKTCAERRDILLKAADLLVARGEEWRQAMIQETGSDGNWFSELDTYLPVEFLRDMAGRLVTVTGTVPNPFRPGRSAILIKEPFGVCVGMAPWNAPHLLGLRSCLGAIAAGNTMVFKGSELSPECHWQIGKLFADAGLPAGVLNIIFSRREDAVAVTSTLIEHPAVKHVNFTGSSGIGRIIASMAGKSLKPCIMELGGKAGQIVLDDADIKLAAECAVNGAFTNSGQVCMSTERIIVQGDIAEKFEAALKEEFKSYPPSASPAVTLVHAGARDKSYALVESAVKQGAEIVAGSLDQSSEVGVRIKPVLIKGVTKEMDLFYTESFGPSVSLFVVKTEEEALQLINDTDYGLNASVFTKDLLRGIRVAKQIESGTVHINNSTLFDDPSYPHGGAKSSGFGRFNSTVGLEAFFRNKTISWRD